MKYIMLCIFFYWLIRAVDLFWGLLWSIPTLRPLTSKGHSNPKISIIFAARNEADKVHEASLRMLSQDYPDFEVIAVNDRSEDATAAALATIKNERFKTITIKDLPAGWLGKTHALYQGYLASQGDWILFTDADVMMQPTTLATAMQVVQQAKLDHLTLFPGLIIKEWIEAIFTTYFTLAFNMRYRPWAASSPKSKAYVGIGAFNFIKRKAYEKIGTHQALALDIADDMILGCLVKRAGLRQAVFLGHEFLSVRWVQGWKGVLSSLHKNAFRGLDYSVINLVGATAALLLIDVLPYGMLFVGDAPTKYLSLGIIMLLFFIYAAGQKYNPQSLKVFIFHPSSSLFFIFILWRSAAAALLQGGVTWRDTFYPLQQLRQGMK